MSDPVVKILMDKITAHASQTPQQIVTALVEMRRLARDPNTDSRTKSRCFEFLVKHDWEVYEHLNPAVQKSEMTISAPKEIPIRLLQTIKPKGAK